MKRVLSSGQIKLPYFYGDEEHILHNKQFPFKDYQDEKDTCERTVKDPLLLTSIKFTFEIKAPLLVFLSFQNACLGALNFQEVSKDQETYLPPSFYMRGPCEFIPLDPKQCNELNTKLNNFYNWSFNFYNKLIDQGLCPEQAQLALPQGLFVSFLWEVTAKDLITFIETNYNKSPELAGYCSTLSLYLDDHLPLISKWLKRNKWKDLI